MNHLEFYKEDKRWYADIPTWEGSKAELEMVEGADAMLDYISKGRERISLKLSDTKFEGSDELRFIREANEYDNGAFYILNEYKGNEVNLNMWLCDVTKFVFGDFPKIIYLSE